MCKLLHINLHISSVLVNTFPFAAYFNPTVYGGSTGLDFGAWVFANVFFELKMMGIFSMLFGAGLVLMFERAQAAGKPFGRIYSRRASYVALVMRISQSGALAGARARLAAVGRMALTNHLLQTIPPSGSGAR